MKGRLIYFLILSLFTLRVLGATPDAGVVMLDPLVEGNELAVQKNELVTGLKDLVNDFDREIDWESESARWSENHDIDLRLDQSCEDRSRLLSLLQTRQKLFYIYKKLTVDHSEWIDLNWYKNRSYTKLFNNREVNFITLVFDENRGALEEGFLIESGHLDDWRLFIDELLNYYARVVMTSEWQEKFERLVTLRHVSLAGNRHFNEIGFPKNKNECYLRGQLFGGNYTVGYDRGTEGWFYGFWLRRYLEGNMEVVQRANTAFASQLTNWGDLTLQSSRYDPHSVMKMLEDYDQVAAQLPGRLRFSAQMTIARLWIRFGKQTRAQEIYESLLALDLDAYERGALSQRLGEISDATKTTGQTH